MNFDNKDKKVVVRTAEQEWTVASETVSRKRVYLEGGVESGRVASVVRFAPGSVFRQHDHPEGEEVLVLSGGWQDANGSHPKGTYMLNPEGFRHAPSSPEGCLLWVMLRQYGGKGRNHYRISTQDLEWVKEDGVATKKLFQDPAFPDSMVLQKWEKGTTISRTVDKMSQFFILEGSLLDLDTSEEYQPQTWIRIPVGGSLKWKVKDGEDVEVYIKTGDWTPN